MTFVTLYTPMLSLLLTWMEKYDTMWKDLSAPLLNVLKTKYKLHFTTLNHTPYYTLHCKLWIFIQVNSKLNGRVQNITRVIIEGAISPISKSTCGRALSCFGIRWQIHLTDFSWFFLIQKKIKIKETKSVLG